MQVGALALEEGMLFYMENDVEISRLAAKRASFAEAVEADASPVFDTGGDFGFDSTLAENSSLPFAFGTRIGDDLAWVDFN